MNLNDLAFCRREEDERANEGGECSEVDIWRETERQREGLTREYGIVLQY
jgi:hypothetical protein